MCALETWLLRVAGGEGGPCSPTEATLPGLRGREEIGCAALLRSGPARIGGRTSWARPLPIGDDLVERLLC